MAKWRQSKHSIYHTDQHLSNKAPTYYKNNNAKENIILIIHHYIDIVF